MLTSKPFHDQLLELGSQRGEGLGVETVILGGDGWELNLG